MVNVVSLFTGAGGLDYGLEAAGFKTKVAVEKEENCCKTLEQNRSWPVIDRDIEEVTSDEILEMAGIAKKDVDVVAGGPPCQPFSKSGYWAKGDTERMDDPRAKTLLEYMRCVEDLQPKVFLLENVKGINYSGKEEGFHVLKKLTQKINQKTGSNYKLSWAVLDTADYGVPQSRRRFFLVGHRDGKKFSFPEPTHASPQETAENLDGKTVSSYVTVWDAIGDLVNQDFKDENLSVGGKWADLLPSIPEGENYQWHTERKGGVPIFDWRSRYWNFLLKLAKDRPSWTIPAQPGSATGPFHWESRLLSVREMARLQTFPEDIEFIGSRNSIQKQIGNAVPSLMGEILAGAIGHQFFGMVKKDEHKLKVEKNRPIPDAERTEDVPEKYLELVESEDSTNLENYK